MNDGMIPRRADPIECTVDQWLELASDAERTARDCGPLDPGYTWFMRNRDGYLRMAIEREATDNDLAKVS